MFTCHICKSEYDTNEKQQKHVNENCKDIEKDEDFVFKYCGKNCGNNSSNLKVHKKQCKHGKVDKLPLLVYECDSCKCKFTNRFNLRQPKAQRTELVKQSKAKIKHTESGKWSSQSESLCEQDNADLQTTTKGDKSHYSPTQSTNFVVKARCEYCDKPLNSISNHRKCLKVCAEATNDCKICGKTFTSVKQYQNHKQSCNMKSHNCMIYHKAF